MRLIYNRKYDTIDSNISDTNIGARKKKSNGITFGQLMASIMNKIFQRKNPNLAFNPLITHKCLTL